MKGIPAFIVALALAYSSVSAAQDGGTGSGGIGVAVLCMSSRQNIPVTLRTLGNRNAAPINLNECRHATIEWRFSGVDTARQNLEWFTGQQCNDSTIRNNVNMHQCIEYSPKLQHAIPNNAIQVTWPLPVRELFTSASGVSCVPGQSGVYTMWVLALNQPQDTTGSSDYASFPLAYDFQAPSAPTGIKGVGGERQFTVKWSGTTDTINQYYVYADPGGCDNGSVKSTSLLAMGSASSDGGMLDGAVALDAGMGAADAGACGNGGANPTSSPLDALQVATKGGSATQATVDFASSVPIPGQVAVAVAAVDRAGNVSALSAPICVGRFHVTSWCDAYADGGSGSCRSSGCSACAAAPTPAGPAAPLSVAAFAVCAVLARRRRK